MDSDELGKRESTGVSRRALLKTGAITSAAAGVAAAGSLAMTRTADAATSPAASGGQRTTPGEDLILCNGRIHTMDGSSTVASVIAIRGGFVAYVGHSISAARSQFADQPRIINLNGAMAVPGLIDCPNPPVSADNFISTIGGFSPNQLGHQINPGQHLTRTEVLEHFTSANRWFLGGTDEDLLGTLEVGRLGDVVVLSDDYFTVADEDLKKLHSVLTVLGGRVVHFGGIQYWA